MEHTKRMKKGFEVLRKMGRLETMMNQKRLYSDLYDLSVGYLFGEIWTRPHLNIRDRELITLASNIALARPAGTHSHYRSAMHLGFTKEEIMETIIHVGHYAGWPAIAHAIIQFEEVLNEDAANAKRKAAGRKRR
ncbi:MAG TPA: carboxymuconolactone decarboxylase family protein [Burkholderiales bacterium]|jgi:4-carboxymuconolactone decarboxylase